MRCQANLFPSWSYITLARWLYPWAKSKFTQRERAAGQEGSDVSTFQTAADMYPADWHVWKKPDSLKYGPFGCSFFFCRLIIVFPEAWKRNSAPSENFNIKVLQAEVRTSNESVEQLKGPGFFISTLRIRYDFSCGPPCIRRQMWLREASQ